MSAEPDMTSRRVTTMNVARNTQLASSLPIPRVGPSRAASMNGRADQAALLGPWLEGWAEYAAGLCEEIGMYAEPRDRYGRMASERFFAARMAVDTGLNVLGWSLDKAAACLRDSGLISEPEIASEVLRYAVDDPGQALAYHAGHRYVRELRGTGLMSSQSLKAAVYEQSVG
jgi:Bacterial protein of unknown function (DUF885)